MCGNYSRAETIWGNTVSSISAMYHLTNLMTCKESTLNVGTKCLVVQRHWTCINDKVSTPGMFEIFKTETDFRLKTVSVAQSQNFPVRNYFLFLGLTTFFFQLKPEAAFGQKNLSNQKIQPPPSLAHYKALHFISPNENLHNAAMWNAHVKEKRLFLLFLLTSLGTAP